MRVIARAASSADVVAVAERVAGVDSVSDGERSTDEELVKIDVELAAGVGTPDADETISDPRAALAALPGADAIVVGPPAADLDQREANIRDNVAVVPLILVVVLFVLIALLRSLLAPLLLLLTVIVSTATAMAVETVSSTSSLLVSDSTPIRFRTRPVDAESPGAKLTDGGRVPRA